MIIRSGPQSENFPRENEMKSIVFSGNEISVMNVEVPRELVSGHLFIKVVAVSVGPLDLGLIYPDLPTYFIDQNQSKGLGSDFSGVVVSVGDSVKRFKVGDEVFGVLGHPIREWSASEYISVHESVCALKPGNISHDEAASVASDALMAERALRNTNTSSTDSILITGGISNIARILTQIASSSMFDSVEWIAATVDSIEDKQYAESVGIAETFVSSSNHGDWSLPFEAGINKKVYDVVVDIVGDSKHAKRLLNRESGGRFVSLYNKISPVELLDYEKRASHEPIVKKRYRFLLNQLNTRLSYMLTGSSGRNSYCDGRYYSAIPTGDGEVLERIAVLIETGIVTCLVHETFKLSRINEAVDLVKNNWRKIRGKVVIRIFE